MKFVITILILFSSALAVFNSFELLFRLAYVLTGILVLSYIWVWSNSRQVKADVEVKGESAQVGQWVEEEIEITNQGLLPKFWLELQVNSSLPGNSKGTVVNLPRHGQTRKWHQRIQCQRRGLFAVGPVAVTSHDPFGLFERKNTLGNSHPLLVYPATVDISTPVLPHPWSYGEGNEFLSAQYTSPSATGIRDYQPTDSLKRIHWPSSIRTGKLMVKEFEAESSNNIWIIVDMEAAAQAGKEADATEEYAASIAASLAKRYLESNNQVGFAAWGDRLYLIAPQKGGDQFIQIMQSLALVKAQGIVPLSQILSWQGRLWGKNSTLIIITPSSDRLWTLGLRQIMLQGARVAVVLLDAGTFDGNRDSSQVLDALTANGIPTHAVKKGQLAKQPVSQAAETHS